MTTNDPWLDDVVLAVRRVLSGRDDLLRPAVRKQKPQGAAPMWGHCYVAAEAVYHLAAARLGYRPWTVRGSRRRSSRPGPP